MKNNISLLSEFQELYNRRPIVDNSGGMKSPHLFAVYSWLSEMKPDVIIESGVWKGLGTWFMRQICPSSKIVCLDIDYSNLAYRDKNATYHNCDITQLNIKSFIGDTDINKVLVFFDDHQNFNQRLDLLLESGLKHVIYEDNYPMGQGDCISPKKILEFNKTQSTMQDKVFNMSIGESRRVESHISHYEEFAPIFRDVTTRWNTPWLYETPTPFLEEDSKLEYSSLFSERLDYTWICRMELSR